MLNKIHKIKSFLSLAQKTHFIKNMRKEASINDVEKYFGGSSFYKSLDTFIYLRKCLVNCRNSTRRPQSANCCILKSAQSDIFLTPLIPRYSQTHDVRDLLTPRQSRAFILLSSSIRHNRLQFNSIYTIFITQKKSIN